MERCVFCQAALDAETRFCWQCGRARSSMLLSEVTTPSLLIAAPSRCAVCGEPVPEGASVCGNCQSAQSLAEGFAPRRETSPAAPMKRCAACGEESPIWARFCGACRQPFAVPADDPADVTQSGTLTDAPKVTGALAQPRVTSRLSDALAGLPERFSDTSNLPTVAHAPVRISAETDPWLPIAETPLPGQPARPASRRLPSRTRLKIIAAVLATALVAISGGATLAYFLTRPAPVMQVASAYLVGKTPAGSPTTTLRVSGQNFSHHSSVTILLDGKPAPGAPRVSTDGFGNFSVSLTVTAAWRYGSHTLTATDARGYTTMTGVQVDIIPRPVITLKSKYQQGGVPAGSTSTTLQVSGQWFSYDSAITFLLDGRPAPGNPHAKSGAQGQVQADLTVTANWGLGAHTLTAKDAQGYVTQSGAALAIVAPGAANTPGPRGAPPDDASFSLAVTVQIQNPLPGAAGSMQETLVISGQADPAGGTVCQAHDNGQPYTLTGNLLDASGMPTGITYQETLTSTCSGSYKGGQLTYTEMATSDQYAFSNGFTCQAATPYTLQTLSGAFSSATAISGSWNTSGTTLTCNPGIPLNLRPAQQGAWSGATH